jgi:hypothetical protein
MHGGPDHRVQAGAVAAAGQDADALVAGHCFLAFVCWPQGARKAGPVASWEALASTGSQKVKPAAAEPGRACTLYQEVSGLI